MNKIKVTDLEKFVLEQVYRPYQISLGIGDKTLEHLTKEYNLDNARLNLIKNKKWCIEVMDRISRIPFYFPDYIKHPLLPFIKNQISIRKGADSSQD